MAGSAHLDDSTPERPWENIVSVTSAYSTLLQKRMDHEGNVKFTFQHEQHRFSCPLKCGRCEGRNKDGQRCQRSVCTARPFCWQHAQTHQYLKLGKSTIPGAGCGVFAWNPKAQDPIVFRKEELVGYYDGESISRQEFTHRYQDRTGPYSFSTTRPRRRPGKARASPPKLYDAACQRSMMSMVNHSVEHANVVADEVTRADHPIEFRALRDIVHGEELLLNYGADYEFDADVEQRTLPSPKRCQHAPR